MSAFRVIRFRLTTVALAVLLLPSSLLADGFYTFKNTNLGFAFEYPASWEIRHPVFPNAQAVVGPKNGGGAECSVTVKVLPQTNSLSQADIDAYFLKKPIAAEFEESLKLQCNEVHIVKVGNSLLGNLPAHVFRVRYSSGKPSGEVFSYALMFGTATPRKTWVLGCGGMGSSTREAEKNFKQWQMAINRLIATFRLRNH